MKVAIAATAETCSAFEQKYPDILFARCGAGGKARGTLRDVGVNGLLIAPAELSLRTAIGVGCVADYTSIPVVLLGELDRWGADLVALLAQSGNPRVHIDHYDSQKQLPSFLRGFSPCREQVNYLDAVRRSAERLPVRTRAAIMRGLNEYPVTGWVQRTAERAGLSERTFRGEVKRCGFRDPKFIYWGSRTIDASGFAKDSGFSPAAVARKCGHANTESLLASLQHVGCRDLAELRMLSGEDVLRRVLDVVIDSRGL